MDASTGKCALISGITGQDGSHLAELLLSKGYRVVGMKRRTSNDNTSRIAHILDKIELEYGELTDYSSIKSVVQRVHPDELYNLACQSHVAVSELCPNYTRATILAGTDNLLTACKSLPTFPKFYQASSSEMFGNSPAPQNEQTPFAPVSPYARAKVIAHGLCHEYRRKDYPVWCGILFNHESPRRGENFVTRKITRALGRMACGLQETCSLGNLAANRDWGFAGDYTEAMWRMLQTDTPDDYVIATGETHSVEEFLDKACIAIVKILEESPILFYGYKKDVRERFITDPALFRPHEVHHLEGDYRKARLALGWEPKVRFEELVRRMVQHDLELARDELAVKQRREVAA